MSTVHYWLCDKPASPTTYRDRHHETERLIYFCSPQSPGATLAASALDYRHSSFTRAAYAVLLSGPSGPADIGGVTVHPAQGVTTMTIILWPRAKERQDG